MSEFTSGFDELESALRHLGSLGYEQPLTKAGHLVETEAKKLCPVDTAQLRGSIHTEVNGNEAIVGTNVVYAPYVEYGTGMFSTLGNGRAGYWVFVKGSHGVSSGRRKEYTLQEAKRVMAILRKKGLDAFYTCGSKPRPFLYPALANKRTEIEETFRQFYVDEAKIYLRGH